ncbi:uncharacterized protein PITG_08889 [Phytophthora infestans T30-4]|uniref:Uncharacterized protein n=1 Tax=Phytophthora infestans (strain T30-4) TaxID=403677 RepID=D0NDF4_PHYIT|nr:uncharacterized protein PITG_08889 [Phytophthora infestans T30-4]EEY56111.1 hypothetical protein PITG_08889 [Phytophthora infestans T30-4]|eukprot:XP_002902941.1 hypothetical protein PITG_08889 [Phytophthora infestans T30-4]
MTYATSIPTMAPVLTPPELSAGVTTTISFQPASSLVKLLDGLPTLSRSLEAKLLLLLEVERVLTDTLVLASLA